MKVKGSVVSSVQKFVQEQYPSDYNNWLNRLPESSKEIFNGIILASEWYPLQETVVEPTRLIGDMFFDGDVVKAARMSGKQSAQDALTGIYKVFVMVATPKFLIKRSSKIMTSFYQPSSLSVGEEYSNGVDLHLTGLDETNEIVEQRIAGWMEKALEICGCRDITIDVTKSMAKGDELTKFVANWS